MKRIHDSLERVLTRNRLVFWYDATGEWGETFDAFSGQHTVKLTVSGNEFGTKVRVVRELNDEAKFLIYIPGPRPADADNWLLDLVLQGYEYRADKASLALQEVGLPHEFLDLAEEHAAFFRSEKRSLALSASTVPGVMILMIRIFSLSWPRRSMRPIRCSMRIGFHGRS